MKTFGYSDIILFVWLLKVVKKFNVAACEETAQRENSKRQLEGEEWQSLYGLVALKYITTSFM